MNENKTDTILQNLANGLLITIGGRPAMGKTNFCLNLVANLCSIGKKCLYFTDDDKEIVISKLVKITANIDNETQLDEKVKKMALAIKKASDWKLFIASYKTFSDWDIKELIQDSKPDYVFIDSNRLYSAQLLKELTNQFEVTIFITSQLKRLIEGKKSHHPVMTDLKLSKDYIYLSDVILLLYRAYYYDCTISDNEKDVLEVIVAKPQSNSIKLKYNHKNGKIKKF